MTDDDSQADFEIESELFADETGFYIDSETGEAIITNQALL
jgi:hypothetical protein